MMKKAFDDNYYDKDDDIETKPTWSDDEELGLESK